MQDDFLKILGTLVVVGFLIYLAVKSMKLQTRIVEGLANPASSTATVNSGSGAANYATKVNTAYSQLKDILNITTYRTDYENVIIQMDDYVGGLMLQELLSIDPNAITEDSLLAVLAKINVLADGKVNLNAMMKFVDGVK